MKVFIGIISALLVLQCTCQDSAPSNGAVEFFSFMSGINSQLYPAITGYQTLKGMEQSLSPSAKAAVAAVESLVQVAGGLGSEILTDLMNPYPMRGLRQFKKDLGVLLDALSNTVNSVAQVSPSNADDLQGTLSQLLATKDDLFDRVKASAQDAKYTDKTNKKSLVEVIDDDTWTAIHDAVQSAIDLMNHAIAILVTASTA